MTSNLTFGRYHIENCRHQFPRLVETIDAAIESVLPAIEDAKLGHRSRHGFRALFKFDGGKDYVVDMLRAIYTLRPKRALEPWPMQPTSPQFACATKNARHIYPFLEHDPWQICQFSPFAAFYAPETSFIFLCPRFFFYPAVSQDMAGGNCPGVLANQWTPNERNLYEYQTYIIIHEMIHFYLQSQTLSGITIPPEQYGLDGCVALGPLNSLHNPTSYQAYIASKSDLVVFSGFS